MSVKAVERASRTRRGTRQRERKCPPRVNAVLSAEAIAARQEEHEDDWRVGGNGRKGDRVRE